MKASYNWIKEYTSVNAPREEYQHRMIMAGTAVETMEPMLPFTGVVVGRVITCEKHENSDHLHICQVDVGGESPLQIVCGAPNVTAGQLVPTAVVGAKLPGLTIKRGKIRGVESEGMLCSSVELMIPTDLYPSVGEAGLLILNEDYPVGMDFKAALGLEDEVIDFDILADRPDCLSIWGVARETAAVFDTAFKAPRDMDITTGDAIHQFAKVTIKNPDLCPRYTAKVVKNLRLGPSPLWMRARLHAAGIRAINNIVDITNYVMLETGHPMHAFDLGQVRGNHIIVREAEPGEQLTTLDGKKHHLLGGELLICDEQGPTGLAGIMGGLESEITENTRELLFECAAFDRTLTRVVSRRLGIRTESSGRFERGVNPATVKQAMARACALIELLDAGDVVPGIIDHYPNPVTQKTLTTSVSRIKHRSGADIDGQEMVNLLTRLDFKAELDGDTLLVTPPLHRSDIEQEADVCEEVLRLAGYDRIPETLMRGETTQGKNSAARLMKRDVHQVLNSQGFDEIINLSFIAQKQLDAMGLPAEDERNTPIRITNPLGEDTAVMRTSLVPDMLRTLAKNLNQRNETALLYELGTVYFHEPKTDDGLFSERSALCLGAYGEQVNFYFVRDTLLALLKKAHITWDIQPGGEPYHHPGRCARILVEGAAIATVGEVHPKIAEQADIKPGCVIAEFDLEAYAKLRKPFDTVTTLPRTPAVLRDLALVVKKEQDLLPVLQEILRAGGKLLEDVQLFDVFEGTQVGEGKKSAAFSLTLRHPEKTLEEEEINRVIEKVKKNLNQAFQAEIRT